MKDQQQLTPLEKAYLLLRWVEDNGRIPKQSEVYQGVKIGSFWRTEKLLRWIEDNGRIPIQSEVYQGVKIGSFWRTEKKKLDKR